MEPLSPQVSPRTAAAIVEAMGQLSINGRDATVVSRDSTTVPLVDISTYQEVPARRSRQFVPVGINNNNNNNNAVEVIQNQDPDLEVVTKIVWDALHVSYEVTAGHIPQLPEIHEPTLSTPLHIALKYLTKYPKSKAFTVLVACLLEAKHDKEFLNANQITPFNLAFATEDELILQLFTHEKPCKATLLELAKAHKRESLIDFLEAPDFWSRFYHAAGAFVAKVKADKSNLYKDVFTFYSAHKDVVSYVFPTSRHTILHAAVSTFLEGAPLGIFECLVIMEMGGDKYAINAKGESPYSVAMASSNPTLIALFQLERPTIEEFNQLIATDPVIPAWLNSID